VSEIVLSVVLSWVTVPWRVVTADWMLLTVEVRVLRLEVTVLRPEVTLDWTVEGSAAIAVLTELRAVVMLPCTLFSAVVTADVMTPASICPMPKTADEAKPALSVAVTV
jgi:hypothetical protein